MLDALWDLVWSGEVTNDTFAPLRALRWKRPSGSGSGARRGRPGRLTALGPPEAAGRWSLVEPLQDVAPTERVHAQALALLERHGVLTGRRSLPKASTADSPGSTPSCEPSRRRAGSGADTSSTAWERRSSPWPARSIGSARSATGKRARRQRLYVLAAADPADPYGAALAWPRRGDGDRRPLQRAAGAYVVLVDGIAALYPERGGSSLQTLPAADDPNIVLTALRGLTTIVAGGRLRELVIRKVDGVTIGESPWRDRLLEVGFTAGYRGLTLRAAR